MVVDLALCTTTYRTLAAQLTKNDERNFTVLTIVEGWRVKTTTTST